MKTTTHLALRTAHFALALALPSTLNLQLSTCLAQGTALALLGLSTLNRLPAIAFVRVGLVAIALAAAGQLSTVFAQGTGFIYQGRLNDGGNPYTGNAEFQATLWDAASGGLAVGTNTPPSAIVAVTNGLFVLPLDFGSTPFAAGAGRWLQLDVRTTIGAFTALSPRQPITPTPYALSASNLTGTLPATQLSGTMPNARLSASVSLLGPSIEAREITDGTIEDVDIAANAAIADLKLGPIRTPGKVANSATTATSANAASTIVARDASGNFAANIVTAASFNGGGAGLSNLPAARLTGTVPEAALPADLARADQVWLLGGNAGVSAASQFVGTIDSAPLVLRAANREVMRLESQTTGYRIIAGRGSVVNAASTNSAVLGGRDGLIEANAPESTIVGGLDNIIRREQRSAFIGGGARNEIQQDNQHAVIAGGRDNRIGTNAVISLVVGGGENQMGNNVDGGLMVGGFRNDIRGSLNPIGRHIAPVLVGGSDNEIGLRSHWASILGGDNNRIGTNAVGAAILAGRDNIVANDASNAVAIGRSAVANHAGAFVWADNRTTSFASAADNSFNIRAEGGVHLDDDTSQFFGNTPRQMLNLRGAAYGIGVQNSTTYFRSQQRFSWFEDGAHSNTANDPGTGGSVLMTLTSGGLTVNGAMVLTSDRATKEDVQPVNPQAILAKVAALPLHTWSYRRDEARSRHLGPMAQDFRAAFGLGADDKHIATVDADGVALAAIQGLNEKVELRSERAEGSIQRLESENAELKQRLAELEQLVAKLVSKGN